MWIWANNDQILLQARLLKIKLYLILILVNFPYELGQIITRYDFLETRQLWFGAMFEPTRTWTNLTFGKLMNFANNDQIWLPRGWMNEFDQFFQPTSTWPNLTFGRFSVARKPNIDGGAIRPTGLLFKYKVYRWTYLLKMQITCILEYCFCE